MTNPSDDRRRHGVIETRFRQRAGVAVYNLTINGELWAVVERSNPDPGRGRTAARGAPGAQPPGRAMAATAGAPPHQARR